MRMAVITGLPFEAFRPPSRWHLASSIGKGGILHNMLPVGASAVSRLGYNNNQFLDLLLPTGHELLNTSSLSWECLCCTEAEVAIRENETGVSFRALHRH
ncbi:MAG: hypothetical protein BJ554DRAFT_3777 [Olpidium bornovanus]|uniref:Uncharacterized protein n=1 Tax=Olpidium bornovanus TaxID=278681 RepID=A0A8H7ZNP2_9FUNG|nr:MAG: hypothetical protein BJ554DRAFT_3777 [Olpidium bornovanus]